MIDAKVKRTTAEIDRRRVEERRLVVRDGAHGPAATVDGEQFRVEAGGEGGVDEERVVGVDVELRGHVDEAGAAAGVP